eukprot:119495_1
MSSTDTKVSYPISCGDVLYVGWLEMQSKYLKSWSNRYIILFMDKCILKIYKTKPKNVNAIAQTLPIETFIITNISNIKHNNSINHFSFQLYSDNKSNQYSFQTWHPSNPTIINTYKYTKKDISKILFFRCECKDSFNAWFELINDCSIRSKYAKLFHNSTLNKSQINTDIKSID